MTEDADLDAFMAEGGRVLHGPACWLCGIPERELVERCYARGDQKAAILRTLQKRYPKEASRHRLGHHFEARHHER